MADSSDVLGGLFGAGASLAMGNPLGVAASLGGLGLSIFGGIQKTEAAQKQAQISQDMAQTEMKQDAVRRQAMEVAARRQQMEVLRNQQRARSLALNNATGQGAQFGSGLQGGYGQVTGQSGVNLLGISQGLQAGEQMFDLNNMLSQQKMQMAQAGGQAATAQGMTSLGGALLTSAGPMKNLWDMTGSSVLKSNSGGIGHNSGGGADY